MNTRRTFAASLAALLLGGLAGAAAAQGFPNGPIKLIVPRAPGGGSDVIARLVSPGLEKKFGVPVIIENRPDTAAVLGAELTAKSKPDGQTYYLSDNSFYQNPAIMESLPYDTLKDLSAVTMLAQGPVILIIHPSVPAKNLKELLALARTTKLSFASGGIGASTHLAGVLLNLNAGVNITHVPFKSSGPALNALLGNHVTMQFGGLSSALPHIQKGTVRAIALTGNKRHPSVPDVPTFAEAGVDVDMTSVWGLHAAAATPLAIRTRMRDAVVEVMREPAVAAKLQEYGYDVIGNTPDEHQKQTEKIVRTWIEIAKKVNLRE